MENTSYKWSLSRTVFSVSRTDFSGALDVLSKKIETETGQTPSLKLSFYRVSKLSEIPEFNIPVCLGEIENPTHVPPGLWSKANAIKAHFSTAATGKSPALNVSISAKWPDWREMRISSEPAEQGKKIGLYMLNDVPRFLLWNRAIR